MFEFLMRREPFRFAFLAGKLAKFTFLNIGIGFRYVLYFET